MFENHRTILPSTSTRLEFDLDKIGWNITHQRFPVPLNTLHDPHAVDESLLPWLAWQRGVDIWFDDWPVERKREVISTAYRDHALKGTLAGIRRYLQLVDVDITYVKLAPRDAYYSRSLTQEEMERWLEGLPQLRLYKHRKTVVPEEHEGAYSDNFCYSGEGETVSAYIRSLAPLLMGDVAYLYRDGIEVPVPLGEVNIDYNEGVQTVTMTMLMPSIDNGEMVWGDGCYNENWLTEAEAAAKSYLTLKFVQGVVTTEFGGDWRSVTSSFTEAVTEDPIDDTEDFFFDHNFLYGPVEEGCGLYGTDQGHTRLFKTVHLTDGNAGAVDVAEGGFCYDDFIWAFPSHTALIGIDVEQPAGVDLLVYGMDDGHYIKTDTTRLDRAVEAVIRSKRLSDVITLDPVTFTQITFGDNPTMDGSYTFGQMIRRY